MPSSSGVSKCSNIILTLQTIDGYASKGFRVMALALGVVRGLSNQALGKTTQEQLEKHAEPFTLLGLLVLSNELRDDSQETITQLQQT